MKTEEPEIPEYVFDSFEAKNPFDYFYNEKGDYTITMHGNPISFVSDEHIAVAIKNSYNALTLRINVQKKQIEASIKSDKESQSRIHELEKQVTELDDTANYVISEIKENNINLFDALESCWKALCSQGIYKHFNEKEVERIQSLISRSRDTIKL